MTRDKDDSWCLTVLITVCALCVAVPIVLFSVSVIERHYRAPVWLCDEEGCGR